MSTTNRQDKQEIHNILNEKRDWHNVEETKPDEGQLVVIRIVNPDRVAWEDDTRYYLLEDIMVAKLNGDTWMIEPPFHKYNYSPLTDRDVLKEGTIVTHWAVPDEDEVDNWHKRLECFNEYDELVLKVDPDHEEQVYRSLMWGAAFIEEVYSSTTDRGSREELQQFFRTLKDLQYIIDQNQPGYKCQSCEDNSEETEV